MPKSHYDTNMELIKSAATAQKTVAQMLDANTMSLNVAIQQAEHEHIKAEEWRDKYRNEVRLNKNNNLIIEQKNQIIANQHAQIALLKKQLTEYKNALASRPNNITYCAGDFVQTKSINNFSA